MSPFARACLFVAAACLSLTAAAGEKGWELQVNDNAGAGGVLTVAVTSATGERQQIPIEIRPGFAQARVSRVVAQTLLRVVGKTCRVERTQTGQILVHRLDGAEFDMAIVANTATEAKVKLIPR